MADGWGIRTPSKSVAESSVYSIWLVSLPLQPLSKPPPPQRSATTMTYNTPESSLSIFQDGKIKPGIYKIQNIVSRTYVDTKDHLRELCGRPSSVLGSGGGQVRLQHR